MWLNLTSAATGLLGPACVDPVNRATGAALTPPVGGAFADYSFRLAVYSFKFAVISFFDSGNRYHETIDV
jgi:hypothetical protein